jgi:hypothetical protein
MEYPDDVVLRMEYAEKYAWPSRDRLPSAFLNRILLDWEVVTVHMTRDDDNINKTCDQKRAFKRDQSRVVTVCSRPKMLVHVQ